MCCTFTLFVALFLDALESRQFSSALGVSSSIFSERTAQNHVMQWIILKTTNIIDDPLGLSWSSYEDIKVRLDAELFTPDYCHVWTFFYGNWTS